jgi:hypothetical protein
MYFLKTWKMAFAAVQFFWKIHEWNSVPRILSLVIFISFYRHVLKLIVGQRNMWLKENWIWNLNNVITKICFLKIMHTQWFHQFPKRQFPFHFPNFFTINTVLCDFLFVIIDHYKSMYLLLPAATVNFDMQYTQKSVFTEHELLFLV